MTDQLLRNNVIKYLKKKMNVEKSIFGELCIRVHYISDIIFLLIFSLILKIHSLK